jgi:hypothetical protein
VGLRTQGEGDPRDLGTPWRQERGAGFRALHEGDAFMIPNPWDTGSARVLAALGFEALGRHELRLRVHPRPPRWELDARRGGGAHPLDQRQVAGPGNDGGRRPGEGHTRGIRCTGRGKGFRESNQNGSRTLGGV